MNPNWFETFFDGLALDLWRKAVTPETTRAEVDFLVQELELPAGGSVLDVPCGNGRHSVEFAARGYRVSGLDISAGFLSEARANAPEVEWKLGDMRELPWSNRFDAAFCFGNSFGYFDHAQCRKFLRAVAQALKPGGRFVLETGVAAESILPALQSTGRMEFGDILYEAERTYNAWESRMDITYTFTRGDLREVKPIHQWVHTLAELKRMFAHAGLEPVEARGGLDGSAYELRSPRLLLKARRYNDD